MRYQPQYWSAGCGWPFSGRWPWSPQWERSPPRWSWNERRRRELARQGRTRLLPGLHCFGNERDYSRSDAALGVEYSGITDVTLGAEALYQHLNEFDELPSNSLTASIEREIVQSIFSWQQDFLQQTLHLNVLLFQFGRTGTKGGSRRLGLDYDWSDGVRVGGGLLAYASGDNDIARQFDKNDRFFTQLTYAF